MASVRGAASPGSAPRKRSREDVQHEPDSSKRRANADQVSGKVFCRVSSPNKTVHFGRNLIQGPSLPDPARRSSSPSRPALLRHSEQEDHDPSPSAQLQAEHRAAQRKTSVQKERSPKKQGAKHTTMLDDAQPSGKDEHQKARGKGAKQAKGVFAPEGYIYVPYALPPTADRDPDETLCLKLDDLRGKIVRFAESFPVVLRANEDCVIDHLLVPGNEHLIRYIGCLAQGGKTNVVGWRTLLKDKICRRALIVGIIGRALKEHVFSDLYFGTSDKFRDRLEKMEKEQVEQDGFFRTRKRAAAILQYEKKTASDYTAHDRAAYKLALQLERLLLPLWMQGGKSYRPEWDRPQGRRDELSRIIAEAGEISRDMRKTPDVIYHWPATFKDEEFEPGRMECFNLKEMISTSPYDRQMIDGIDRAILRRDEDHRSEAVVRVVCFPGVVAYRQNGGELAQRELAEEAERRAEHEAVPPDVQAHRKRFGDHNNTPTGEEGFRTRILCKSIVLLEWSKQRLLTKEAGTSVHMDAMKEKNDKNMDRYDDSDDYAELWQVFEKVKQRISVCEQENEWYRMKRKDNRSSSGFWNSLRPF